jgi:hypothetical protein
VEKPGRKTGGLPRINAWKKGVKQQLWGKGPNVKKRRTTKVVETSKFVEGVTEGPKSPPSDFYFRNTIFT